MQVWTDPRFEAVPEQRRVALFREFKALLGEVEAYQRSQAAQQAEAERAAAAAARAAAEAEAKVGAYTCYKVNFYSLFLAPLICESDRKVCKKISFNVRYCSLCAAWGTCEGPRLHCWRTYYGQSNVAGSKLKDSIALRRQEQLHACGGRSPSDISFPTEKAFHNRC